MDSDGAGVDDRCVAPSRDTSGSDTRELAVAKPPRRRAASKHPSVDKAGLSSGAGRPPARRTRVKADPPGVLPPVRAGDEAWTVDELAQVRAELQALLTRYRSDLDATLRQLNDIQRDSGDGAGDDQADAGAKTFEREHEMSLANNRRDLLAQAERALGRLDDGTYGVCESCGLPIGKARLQAFPSATLDVTCKQRQERR